MAKVDRGLIPRKPRMGDGDNGVNGRSESKVQSQELGELVNGRSESKVQSQELGELVNGESESKVQSRKVTDKWSLLGKGVLLYIWARRPLWLK